MKGECDGLCFMTEEAGCMFCRDIVASLEMGEKFVVRDPSCLWEAVHTFVYFGQEFTVLD